MAHYRSGDWQAARDALNEAIQLRGEGNDRDWFFLAMTLWQEGKPDEAKKCFEDADQWMKSNRPDKPELRRVRDEAAELLGLSGTPVPQDSRTESPSPPKS